MSNGAASDAWNSPRLFRKLKPMLIKITPVDDSPAPVQSISISPSGSIASSSQLGPKLMAPMPASRTNDQRHPMVETNQPATRIETTWAKGMPEAGKPMAWACCSRW